MKSFQKAIFPSLFIAFATSSGYMAYKMIVKVPTEVIVLLGLSESSDKYNTLMYYFLQNSVWGLAVVLLGLLMTAYLLITKNKDEQTNVIYVEKIITKNAQNDTQSQVLLEPDELFIQNLKQELSAYTKDLDKAKILLTQLANYLEAAMGAVYRAEHRPQERHIEFMTGYAYHIPDSDTLKFEFGEGLTGQVAKEQRPLHLAQVPQGYTQVQSGLGSASANALLIVPIINQYKQTQYIIELAAFLPFEKTNEMLVQRAGELLL